MDSITTEELAELGDRATLIDVREDDEYESGHVPWALSIPLGDLESRLDEVPTGEAVYVICQSGGRSARAAEWLEGQGIDAINVEGGTGEWIAEGRDVLEGAERE